MSAKKKKEPRGGAFEGLRALRDELERKEAEANEKKAARGAAKAPAPAPKRRQADDDPTVLRRAYAGVQPIDRARGALPRTPLGPTAGESPALLHAEPDRAGEDAARERLRALAQGRSRFEVSDPGDRVEGRRTDVPLDVLRRLRRGSSPIDARLDLHGLIAREARSRLEEFLRKTHADGERCVLVIHGKGEHSPMGVGVLRGEISAWLSQGASSEHVAAFATAREADGGEGAVYVLLAKGRGSI